MSAIPEPAQRLAPAARWAWRLSWAGGCILTMVVLYTAGGGLPGSWQTAGMIALAVALLAGTPLVPELRWRRWRWEVREHEIDLQRGIVVVRRTLIPMARVQHVETERGLIGQALGLSTVEIHTAAGSHEIPLLRDLDAGAIRARIAELARTDADG
jgi:membrane protein YdbS with pleckstrin-like domain